jgi:hypothetical protein
MEPEDSYTVHNILPPNINPTHKMTSNFLRINFNIILPSTPRSPKWPLPFRFFDKYL